MIYSFKVKFGGKYYAPGENVPDDKPIVSEVAPKVETETEETAPKKTTRKKK